MKTIFMYNSIRRKTHKRRQNKTYFIKFLSLTRVFQKKDEINAQQVSSSDTLAYIHQDIVNLTFQKLRYKIKIYHFQDVK